MTLLLRGAWTVREIASASWPQKSHVPQEHHFRGNLRTLRNCSSTHRIKTGSSSYSFNILYLISAGLLLSLLTVRTCNSLLKIFIDSKFHSIFSWHVYIFKAGHFLLFTDDRINPCSKHQVVQTNSSCYLPWKLALEKIIIKISPCVLGFKILQLLKSKYSGLE